MSNRKGPSLFKRISAWLHLWLGLVSGLIVFIVGITGSAYVFNKEISDVTESWRNVPERMQPRLTPSQLMASAEKQFPKKHISFVRYEKGKASYAGLVGKGYSLGVYMDPYTGQVLKTKDFLQGGDFFSFVLQGHRNLWLPREIGRPIVDGAILVFVILLITGMVLWWPKKWNAKTRDLSFKIAWRAKFKRLNYDLHKMPGFYSMLLLFILAVTGLVFGYQWMSKTVFFVASGGKSQPAAKRPVSDTTAQVRIVSPQDSLYMKCQFAEGLLFIFNPEENADPIQVSVNSDPSTNHGTYVRYYDRYTLKELKASGVFTKPFSESTGAEQLSRLNYDIHTGQVGGLFTKIIVFILGLVAASLPVTGFLIWLGRRKKSKPSKPTQKQEIGANYFQKKPSIKAV